MPMEILFGRLEIPPGRLEKLVVKGILAAPRRFSHGEIVSNILFEGLTYYLGWSRRRQEWVCATEVPVRSSEPLFQTSNHNIKKDLWYAIRPAFYPVIDGPYLPDSKGEELLARYYSILRRPEKLLKLSPFELIQLSWH